MSASRESLLARLYAGASEQRPHGDYYLYSVYFCITIQPIHYSAYSSRVVVSVWNVSVSRWYRGVFSNVSVSSRYHHSNVSVSSWSQHHTSHLHRTSKFKLRTITTKFCILYNMRTNSQECAHKWGPTHYTVEVV